MFNRLSLKITFLYVIIIITTIVYLVCILMFKYEDKQFQKNEIEYLTYANIFERTIREDVPNITTLIKKTDEYGLNIDGRIVVLDTDGTVLADEYKSYIGMNITNNEIRKSLKNKEEAVGYYRTDNEYIMMVSTPILQVDEVIGIVLISTSVTHIKEDVESLISQAVGLSILAIVIATTLSIITGKHITKPVRELTSASQRILKGKLDTKVDIIRNDELGKLALTFNKMSEELDKLDTNRRRFMSNVSHELKTPLASIKALIESLIDGNDDLSTYKEYLTDVNDEIDRLSSLIRSLLAAARLEEEKVKREPLNLYDEIQSTMKMFEPLAREKNIKIFNNCKRDIIIAADRYKFREVLINLVDNSIKYNYNDGYIEIGCKQRMWKKILIIKDNGQGIPENDLPFIFDNFYRVDKSRKKDSGGSGVGLYIVKKIIELHEWDISVKSTLGKGTEFIIEIG